MPTAVFYVIYLPGVEHTKHMKRLFCSDIGPITCAAPLAHVLTLEHTAGGSHPGQATGWVQLQGGDNWGTCCGIFRESIRCSTCSA
eukprot:4136604-Karenia_brevis.AAC.1